MPEEFAQELTFGPEEGINLDQPPVFLAGILVPTYGEYGGPGYTAGRYFSATGIDYSVRPIDPLDALFRAHDIAYDPAISGTDPLTRAKADVALIEGISRIPNDQLDADAAIYGGLATIAFIGQVELGPYPELLSDEQNVRYVGEALHDIQRGLSDLDAAELAVLAPLVDATLDAFSQLFSPGLNFGGGFGDDRLEGGSGNDTLSGGFGDDLARGGEGNDRLEGGAGNDRLEGGSGNDTLEGELGNDTLEGEAGDDRLGGGLGDDRLGGGEGNDYLSGGDGTDYLSGAGGVDRLEGGTGVDRLEGGEGGDTLEGEADNDTIEGEAGNDRLGGGSGDDRIGGGSGDDLIFGDVGNDLLFGGEGNDVIEAGAGNDRLFGGAGNDRLVGGDGSDVFSFEAVIGRDVIVDFRGEDVIELSAGRFANFAAVLARASESGASTIITDGDNVLTLEGVSRASLNADDFRFI